METVKCQRELTGRQVGAVSGNVLPGGENACSEPGIENGG